MPAGDGTLRGDVVTAGVSAAALLVGVCRVFPSLRVEAEVLALRLRYLFLHCEGGSYGETQQHVRHLLRLERKRRLREDVDVLRDVYGVADTHAALPEAQPVPEDKRKRLVLIGGGHTHVHTLRSLREHPMEGTDVVLISRGVQSPYCGRLPGYIAGTYDFSACHVNLAQLCAAAGVKFVAGEVMHIDAERSAVRYRAKSPSEPQSPVSSGRIPRRGDSLTELGYDVLSVDIGSEPRGFFGTGKQQHVTPAKPIDLLDSKWCRIKAAAVSSVCERRVAYTLAIVGAGSTGCELALAADAHLRELIRSTGGDDTQVRVVLIGRTQEPLGTLCPAARSAMAAELARRKIAYHGGVTITSPVHQGLRGRVASGAQIEFPCDEAMWCTEAGTALWLSNTTLTLDRCGFIRVRASLQTVSHPNVFAAGDCASLPTPVAKAGVVAACEAPVLTRNLRRYLHTLHSGAPCVLEDFAPPATAMGLLGTGAGTAIVVRGCMAVHAPWVWHLKLWVDSAWMRACTPPLP